MRKDLQNSLRLPVDRLLSSTQLLPSFSPHRKSIKILSLPLAQTTADHAIVKPLDTSTHVFLSNSHTLANNPTYSNIPQSILSEMSATSTYRRSSDKPKQALEHRRERGRLQSKSINSSGNSTSVTLLPSRLKSHQDYKGFQAPTLVQKTIAFRSLNASPKSFHQTLAPPTNGYSTSYASGNNHGLVVKFDSTQNSNNTSSLNIFETPSQSMSKKISSTSSGLKQLLDQPKWNRSTFLNDFINYSNTSKNQFTSKKSQQKSVLQQSNQYETSECSTILGDQANYSVSETLRTKLSNIESELSFIKVAQQSASDQPRKQLLEMSSQLSEMTSSLLLQQQNQSLQDFFTSFSTAYTNFVTEIGRQVSNDCFERGQLLEKLYWTLLAIAEEMVREAVQSMKRCEADKLKEFKRVQVAFKHRLESDTTSIERLTAAAVQKDTLIKNLYVQCESYKRSAQQAEMHRSLLTNDFDALQCKVDELLNENIQLKIKIDETHALNSVFLRNPNKSMSDEVKDIMNELNMKREFHQAQQKLAASEVEEVKSHFKESTKQVEKSIADMAMNPRNVKTRDIGATGGSGEHVLLDRKEDIMEFDEMFAQIETAEAGVNTSNLALNSLDQATTTADLIQQVHCSVTASVDQAHAETQVVVFQSDKTTQVDIKRALNVASFTEILSSASIADIMTNCGWDRAVEFPVELMSSSGEYDSIVESVNHSCELWSMKNQNLSYCLENKDEFTANDFTYIKVYLEEHLRRAQACILNCLSRAEWLRAEKSKFHLSSIDLQLDLEITADTNNNLEITLQKLVQRLKDLTLENKKLLDEVDDSKKNLSAQNLMQSAVHSFMSSRNPRRSAGITTAASTTAAATSSATANITQLEPRTRNDSLKSTNDQSQQAKRFRNNSLISMHVQSPSAKQSGATSDSSSPSKSKSSLLKKLVQSAMVSQKLDAVKSPDNRTTIANNEPMAQSTPSRQRNGNRKSSFNDSVDEQKEEQKSVNVSKHSSMLDEYSPQRRKLSQILEDKVVDSSDSSEGSQSPVAANNMQSASRDRSGSILANPPRIPLRTSLDNSVNNNMSNSPSIRTSAEEYQSLEKKYLSYDQDSIGPSAVDMVKAIDSTVSTLQPTSNVYALMRIHLAQGSSNFTEAATLALVKAIKQFNNNSSKSTPGSSNLVYSKLPQIIKVIYAVIGDIAKAGGLKGNRSAAEVNAFLGSNSYSMYHFHIYLYEYLLNNYGTGQMSAKKFTQTVHGIMAYKKHPRMKLVSRFLSGEYDLQDFSVFVQLVITLHPELNSLDEKVLVSSARVTDMLNVFFMPSLDTKKIAVIEKQLVTTAKVKGISKTSYVYDLDVMIQVLMDNYIREIKAQAKLDYSDIWYGMDTEKHDAIEFASFKWLLRHFNIKMDSATILELFTQECDKMAFGESRISFDRFVLICISRRLLSIQHQTHFWETVQQIKLNEVRATKDPNRNAKSWQDEAKEIKLRFIQAKCFDKRRKRMLNQVDVFTSNPKKSHHTSSSIAFMKAFLVRESQALILDTFLEALIPSQLSMLSSAAVSVVQKKALKQINL